MIVPSRSEFRVLARGGKLVPVYRDVFADHDTPVSAFRKIDDGGFAFLLESVEGGEKWGRFSLLGARPSMVFVARGESCEILRDGQATPCARHPLVELEELLDRHQAVALPGLPRFCGGAVGFFGYDAVRWFERVPTHTRQDLTLPDAVFLFGDVVSVFDNLTHTLKVVSHARDEGDPDRAYDAAVARIDAEVERLKRPIAWTELGPGAEPAEPTSSTTREQFLAAVERAKEHIRAGDIFQVVLAHRMSAQVTRPAFETYRALRVTNPSPYMYFLRLGDFSLVGSSPEVLVRRSDGQVEVRPIAGTRPRGRGLDEDRRLEDELCASEKERAEHVMLVDLGRNDVGRVAEYGTVETNEYMKVERYSQVMHLVSNVRGRARAQLKPLDVVRACFPAGTVSGAPKVRAMEIIEDLEPVRRGPYAGAVGHFDYHGNLDLCIAIRTLVYSGGMAHWGVGAGIVADSEPEREWEETLNKGRALWLAVQRAERGNVVIAVIDNYDSFTYNLVQYLGTLGAEVEVHRNDAITVDALAGRPLEGVVISPGPGEPRDAGISEDVIRKLAGTVPILGVCLGHQALGEVYGGKVVRASRLMHGKTSPILHKGRGLFAGLDNPFEATRYHSLIVERSSVPDALEIVAWTPENEIMGLKHKQHETWGVQFHPESVLTKPGLKLIENFLTLCRQQRSLAR